MKNNLEEGKKFCIVLYLNLGKKSKPMKQIERVTISQYGIPREIRVERPCYPAYIPELNKATLLGYTATPVSALLSKFMEIEDYKENFWPFTYWMYGALYTNLRDHPYYSVTRGEIGREYTSSALFSSYYKTSLPDRDLWWVFPLLEDSIELHLYLFYTPLVLLSLYEEGSFKIEDIFTHPKSEYMVIPSVLPLISPSISKKMERAEKRAPEVTDHLKSAIWDLNLILEPFYSVKSDVKWQPACPFAIFQDPNGKLWLEFFPDYLYFICKVKSAEKIFGGIYPGAALKFQSNKRNFNSNILFIPPLFALERKKISYVKPRGSIDRPENLFFALVPSSFKDFFRKIEEEHLLIDFSFIRDQVEELQDYILKLHNLKREGLGGGNINAEECLLFREIRSNIIWRKKGDEIYVFMLNPYLMIFSTLLDIKFAGSYSQFLKCVIKLRKKLSKMEVEDLIRLSRPINDVENEKLEEELKEIKEGWESCYKERREFYKKHLGKANKAWKELIDLAEDHRIKRIRRSRRGTYYGSY